MRNTLKCAIAAAALITGSCSSSTEPDGVVCTAIAVAGVNLTIVDSLTNAPAAFTGLWARAREGTYVDSTTFMLTNPSTGAVTTALAYERKGTYVVTVKANGYQEWTKSGVTVTSDVCHVIPVQLTAKLVR